jgi:hypothetical protein
MSGKTTSINFKKIQYITERNDWDVDGKNLLDSMSSQQERISLNQNFMLFELNDD